MNKSTTKIRIAYVIGSLRPGGAERHLVELIKALDKDKFFPIVYCMSEKGSLSKEIEDIGVTVKCFHLKNDNNSRIKYIKNLVQLMFKMIKELRRDSPDIVHTYLYWANIIGGISAKLAGVKYLITSRRSLGLFKDNKNILQTLENILNTFTDLITVNSKEVLKDTEKREKFIKNKIKLIYNGVNHGRFLKQENNIVTKESLGIPNDHNVITNVSNLIHYKGHIDFVEALSIVIKTHPDITALLVGRDGGMLETINKKAEELNIKDHIKILGTRSDVVEILNMTDIQVLSSHEEGFSNAILEGMACSLPLVVTDVGGNAEAVQDGINGFVVPPRDSVALSEKLLELIVNREIRAAMGIKSREFIEDYFTINHMVNEYDKMYTNILQDRESSVKA